MDDIEYEYPQSKHILLIDGSNLLFRKFAYKPKANSVKYSVLEQIVSKDQDTPLISEYDAEFKRENTITSFIDDISFYMKKTGATDIVVCMDLGKSWRHAYSISSNSITQKEYKGNRRQAMTEKELKDYELMKAIGSELQTILKEYTNVKFVAKKILEADDVIAGFTQILPHHYYTIVSTDKDLIQLIKNDKVRLLNPDKMDYREIDDVEYFIFLKCIRGDSGDNVMSAYPKVRETKIKKAFENAFDRENMMKTTWKNMDEVEFVVGEVFKENQTLMDLSKQPEEIRNEIVELINEHFYAVKSPKRIFDVIKSFNDLKLTSLSEKMSKNPQKYAWLCI